MVTDRAATLGELLQAWLLRGLLGLFGALPLRVASAIGGGIGRIVGPRLAITRRARRNLERALPDLSTDQHSGVIREMWDNLGRVAAEYAHLSSLRCFGPEAQVEVVGTENVDAVAGRPVIFFSGHLGNWEIGYIAARQYGLSVSPIYRAADNPAVEAVILRLRRALDVDPISKGAAGARRIIAALKAGRALTMLVDQKMNDGILVPFFGRDAMTAPALAELALRYDCALLPARVERLAGARFRVTVLPALDLPRSGDRPADVQDIMARVNAQLESWIRATPGQWFWLHRRWPDS